MLFWQTTYKAKSVMSYVCICSYHTPIYLNVPACCISIISFNTC